MTSTHTYTLTGYMGDYYNSLYDENQRCGFAGNYTYGKWSKQPQIGDEITIESYIHGGANHKVWINGQLVFTDKPTIK